MNANKIIFLSILILCNLKLTECDSRDFITGRGTSIPGEVVLHHDHLNRTSFYCSNMAIEKDKLSPCRWGCLFNANQFSMFDRISYDKLSPELREFLFPQIREIEKKGATEDVAQRYSIMCAFDISWNESIRFMGKIAKEGAFSHEYSLEEALFIAHMHTKAPSAIERWLKGNKYHEEQLTYTACLAASITKILTTDGRLPSSFSLDKPTITTESRESLVNSNVKKLVNAYLGDQQ